MENDLFESKAKEDVCDLKSKVLKYLKIYFNFIKIIIFISDLKSRFIILFLVEGN